MDDTTDSDSYGHDHERFSESTGSDRSRQRVFDEFPRWHSRLRNTRLAARAERLWRMLLEGGLTRKDLAIVVGALLYCVSPFDLTPDFIPVVGLLDDLLVVVSVLACLERGQTQEGGQ